MQIPNPFQREKSLEDLEEESQRTELQYSIEQKKAAIREAKKRGVSPKSFGSIKSLITWLKTH